MRMENPTGTRGSAVKAVLSVAICLAGYKNIAMGGAKPFDLTEQGHERYALVCSNCHGSQLEGSSGPPLTGATFSTRYLRDADGRMALGDALRRMPRDAPNSLTADQYAQIEAFIVLVNAHSSAVASTPTSQPKSADSATYNAQKERQVSSGPGAASTAVPGDDELLHPQDGDWIMFNRDYKGSRFSPLAQITAGNADRLQAACVYQTGATGSFHTSPIFYGGVGYITTSHDVQAFDGASCEPKWRYTYEPAGEERMSTNRGVALYAGKVFRGTADCHLIALDAVTGKLLWNVQVADSTHGWSVGVAPLAFRGLLFVALAGGDYGANGHILAYEASTGRLVWTFNSIPSGAEAGADTWSQGAEHGGGATWTSFALDPADATLYAPIGNPAPDLNTAARPGSNLYTNSVVALDATSGRLRWYVQQHPADFHDWDTSAAPVLYEREGRRYMAVGSKDGFLYIYDRDSHALISRSAVTTINENVDVPLTEHKDVYVCPGGAGGVVYYGPAFHPGTKALYVGSMDWCNHFTVAPKGYRDGEVYMEGIVLPDPQAPMRGWLYALDSASGKTLWRYPAPSPMYGGVTPTAGNIIFTARSDGHFLVFEAKKGRVLYEFNTGGSVASGVSTYLAHGRQYVAVASGNRSMMPTPPGGTPTIVVFSLPSRSTH
jgi:alcohol dehydrogenase (cytochrome c)